MPPRKSTSSIPPTDNEERSSPAAGTQMTEQQIQAQSSGVSVEDFLLPRSVTQRLVKSVLPPETAIQKDALLAIQKAATVFVSYLSSHANEATLKRTLAPADVLAALSDLEFDSFLPQLERELDAHTEALADKKKALKDKKTAPSTSSGTAQNDSKEVGQEEGNSLATIGDDGKKKDSKTATSTTTTSIKGNKRIKRDSAGNEKSGVSPDETELEEPDEDETEEEEVEEDEEEDEEEEDDDDDVDENETQPTEDLDRVEDLDAGNQAEEASDSDEGDEDDDGPAAQLRSNMGLG